MRITGRIVLVTLAVVALPLVAHAQDLTPAPVEIAMASFDAGQPAGPAPTPEHTGLKALFSDLVDDFKHLPVKENFWIAAIGGGVAAASHPADTHLTPYLVDASWAHPTFAFGAVLGQAPTLLAASFGTYFVGRFSDNRKVSHVGMDMLEALAMSEALVQPIKYAVGRQRPDGTSQGFPSGHAADTFAVATALERHAGWKMSVPAYIGATYVAVSRLHDNRHYLSDVLFGAAVGIISGRTVTRHGAAFPLGLAPVPVPGGMAVVYTRNGM